MKYMGDSNGRIKLFFYCSGIGIMNRGIESFFREAFDGLKGTEGLDLRLLKGGEEEAPDESRLWNLPRTGFIAELLGRAARRNSYVIEQWSTFIGVARLIRNHRPQIIFYSDANMGYLLYWFRKQIGVPYRLLYSNGGPCSPPFIRTDFVHQVAPYYLEHALSAGEPKQKHYFVPYGLNVGPSPLTLNDEERRSLRSRLGMPLDRPVVLSVGWIQRRHKRMHYVIEEIARLSEPRPYLQLIGAIDKGSEEIIELGYRLLGEDGFGVKSVPYRSVRDYYRAADLFVLASLEEGFGRVYLEALEHGLPVIAHRHPVMEYVLGDAGTLADLSRSGELAGLISRELSVPLSQEKMEKRWQSVRARFSWPVLAPAYAQMFRSCLEGGSVPQSASLSEK
jgi:1,2-diacylglycerol 3-alpha-glucosyltransferase